MNLGISFLRSKLARRFCTLFLLCAFAPILILATISYYRVVNQLESQSFARLKRETKAYSLGLFDRLVRVENDLHHLKKSIFLPGDETSKEVDADQMNGLSATLLNVSQLLPGGKNKTLYGTPHPAIPDNIATNVDLSSPKPFLLPIIQQGSVGRIFMGINFLSPDGPPATIIGEIRTDYLWGIGAAPLLPPMTELFVFNAAGESIVGTSEPRLDNYHSLQKTHDYADLHVFRFELAGDTYFGSTSNVFFQSRYQPMGWTIILAQTRKNIMSALEQFSTTFPFIMLLFLLLILFLSVKFIREALKPLETLKTATKRIALQDFSKQVAIPGDDEFAELGTAFNTMSQTIEQQFHTMETVGEIDRAILSSTEKISIIYTAMKRLKSFFNCDLTLFARTVKHSDELLKAYILEGRRANDPFIKYFNIHSSDREKLFTSSTHTLLYRDNSLPSFLENDVGENINQYLALPISTNDDTQRILLLGWNNVYELSDNEREQSRQIADQIAVALSNSHLVENLEHLANGTIEALARTVDAKSLWTAGHSERVAELSGKIAEAMGFPEEDIILLTRGGLMHDIGKIGISLSILDKPDRLTDDEYQEVKNHPSIGVKILEPIDAFSNILTIVEQHHEKYDGTGYPHGLKGEEIDIKARILAVADVWDAVVSQRPYRDGWVHERAISLITKGSGTHFDPQVVKTFLAIMDN